MKVQFDKNDIVVLATAYGQMIVRTEHDPEVGVFMLIDSDSNFEPVIEWRGSFESCLTALAKNEGMAVALHTPPILHSPDEAINGLIKRV